MAQGGNRSRSAIPLLGFVAAALVFVASLVVTGERLLEQADLEANGYRVGFWESSQALSEAQRLRAELYRWQGAPAGPVEAAAFRLRFDILWSRLALLDGDIDKAHPYPAIDQVRRDLPGIFDRLRQVEALMPRLAGGEAAAFERAGAEVAHAILAPAEGDLRDQRARPHRQRVAALRPAVLAVARRAGNPRERRRGGGAGPEIRGSAPRGGGCAAGHGLDA
jgi:hypothetical protein